ncbi:peroxide stress protein YaaA [Psittacicella gerlachiana]|uniref:UPF0246 protein CKF59_00245 n=1 Tax=Psittacicella gerlachiana TaxID=2028574 RepID=A0A3A1YQX3_9GAMM|nr:peroxide stress protein YaaA [Psittacicella gerlachiana]RIY38794.1 hypothetical protein CKF59_00245 [Psittacicella gerlachiana]
MLVLLSPAKTFNTKFPVPHRFPVRAPEFYTKKTEQLIAQLKELTQSDLESLLDVSEKIAQTNFERYRGWTKELTEANAKPAVFSFWGDVNKHFDAFSLTTAQLNYADEHVLYLSGLYGPVRPLDFIKEYRLEMGKSLVTSPTCKNLYQFWREPLVSYLNQRITQEKIKVIVNLASKEYAGAVDFAQLKAPVIEIQFKDQKNGVYKVISVIAKRSRGEFARWIVENKVTEIEQLKEFNVGGYYFKVDESTDNLFTFYRDEK